MANRINLKNAVFKIKDGTSMTPLTVTVNVGEGNLTYTEARNLDYVLDRGNLSDVAEGADIPVNVSFEFTWDELLSDDNVTIEDALKKRGDASAWVSTDSDTCRPYAVDLEITHTPPDCQSKDKEVVLLPDFRWDSLGHDYKAATVSCTGRCNVKQATVTRVAQT